MMFVNSESAHTDLMLKNIMKMRWTNYLRSFNIDGIFCYDPSRKILVAIYEGSGENLLEEDYENGCVDYWYVNVGTIDEGFYGGGMMLLEKVIRDVNPTIEEILETIEYNEAIFDGMWGFDLKGMLMLPNKGNAKEHAIYEEEQKRRKK